LSTRPSILLAGAALVAAAVLAYHGSFAVPFFFDDHAAITHNPTIRSLSRLGDVLLPPNTGSGMTGRPIVNLSLALNYALGGFAPGGYHVFNLALHALAGLTLFGLVRRSLNGPVLQSRFQNHSLPLAFGSALLWTVHPLQVESVTCVIQRTELLVGLFYLFTLYAFVRATETPASRLWPAASITACALGMASKEVMVSAPLMALLYDRTFVAGSFRSAWRQRSSLYLGLAATWLLLGALLLYMGGTRGNAAGFGLGMSWWSYALKQCEAIVTYLRLAIWPHPLVIDYGTAVVTDVGQVAPQLAFLVALAGGTFATLRWRPRWGFLGFWFCALLAPSSSVIPLVTQTMAEHRMYLPLAAVVIVVVAGTANLMPLARTAVIGAASLALLATTIARNRVLQDEVTLWTETVAHAPDNPRAHASLGLALADRGRAAAAIPHYQRALDLDPQSAATEQNLGNAYFQLRNFTAAADHFRRVVALDPKFASGYNNLGAALLELRDIDGALTAFGTALRLDPQHVGAHRNAARALFGLGRFRESLPHYEHLQHTHPNSPDAHYDLGLALARTGDPDRAAHHFEAALRLRPSPGSYFNYARFLAEASRTSEAIAALETALRLRPDFPEARIELDRLRRR
jgi:tetratricopeptide (TPR) repeat protein